MGIFKKRKKKKSLDFSHLCEDMTVSGNVDFSEALEIVGTVNGTITATDEKSELAIRKGAKVIGDVYVSLISINGEVEGSVNGNRIELAEDAYIKGDIFYNVLEMAQGARVDGKMIHMEKMDVSNEEEVKLLEEPEVVNAITETDA